MSSLNDPLSKLKAEIERKRSEQEYLRASRLNISKTNYVPITAETNVATVPYVKTRSEDQRNVEENNAALNLSPVLAFDVNTTRLRHADLQRIKEEQQLELQRSLDQQRILRKAKRSDTSSESTSMQTGRKDGKCVERIAEETSHNCLEQSCSDTNSVGQSRNAFGNAKQNSSSKEYQGKETINDDNENEDDRHFKRAKLENDSSAQAHSSEIMNPAFESSHHKDCSNTYMPGPNGNLPLTNYGTEKNWDPERSIRKYFQMLLQAWEYDLACKDSVASKSLANRKELQGYKHCVEHMKPLFLLCKRRTLQADIAASLLEIVRCW
jgi:hypothetical protein